MAARSIASGTISFGLVAIPVKLYSTVDTTKAIHFNYLSKDGSRLKQRCIRTSDGKVVEADGKIQGYEFQKGPCVMFTPEELKAMNVEASVKGASSSADRERKPAQRASKRPETTTKKSAKRKSG